MVFTRFFSQISQRFANSFKSIYDILQMTISSINSKIIKLRKSGLKQKTDVVL